MKQRSTLHRVYNPDWFWRFSYFPDRRPELLWAPFSLLQSSFLGTVGYRESIPEILRSANKILGIFYVFIVFF
jgi:hypothetical protein